MSKGEGDTEGPKAVVHKRILELARDRPDATIEQLASEISGASPDLVQRVLDKHGDPAADEEDKAAEQDSSPSDLSDSKKPTGQESESVGPTAWGDLTEKQQEMLRVVQERLSATQEEIGEALGVSAATVSSRLNEIEGFEWSQRRKFVSELVEPQIIGDGQGTGIEENLTEIETRIDQLEDRLKAMEAEEEPPEIPPELTHKVLHACLKSEQFTEEEELNLIRALV